MSASISQIRVEHHESGFGIGHASPRLSWSFAPTTVRGWIQTGYEIEIDRSGTVDRKTVQSATSVLVPWPSAPLQPRERAIVRVRAIGSGESTEWAQTTVERGLDPSDWKASMISAPAHVPLSDTKPPFIVSTSFSISADGGAARLYATAYGIYEVEINGQRVGDQFLSPGWTTYRSRLRYQTYDIGSYLRPGKNTISAYVGEGWYAGRLGRAAGPGRDYIGTRNLWGDRIGFLGQVEVDGKPVCLTDQSWVWSKGPVTRSEIYDGEDFDSTKEVQVVGAVELLPFPAMELVASDAPPVRQVREVAAVDLITTPSGNRVLDFGQNLVGWLRLDEDVAGSGEVVIRHAEVLENGELGIRPLRSAKPEDRIKLGGKVKGWQVKFTFHGFRYAEVSGIPNLSLKTFTAVVVSSDMRRTGHFECSHAMINRLHENVVWSMMGNFVSVPTDCPQRDERLGWTGDIQVFAPTANYLYDTTSLLAEWLWDLESEQDANDGIPPFVIPSVPMRAMSRAWPHSVWADVTALLPRDLHLASGDESVLSRQYASMTSWLNRGIPRKSNGLWDPDSPQFADWLDPRAPPTYPAHGLTDTHLVANAYLVLVTRTVADIARTIGKSDDHARYADDAQRLLGLFRDEYITKTGRTVSDSQTALALALHLDLFETDDQRKTAAERLVHLVRWWSFKITTGFAGTPIVLQVLADNGHLGTAYRMLQEKDCPSWLYPVGMGATTIWERWDSMMEDGSINPGQMTSFNHYALGAVADFLHSTVAGLSPLSPAWTHALIRPQPGGTISSAKTSFDSPVGRYSVDWKIESGKLVVVAEVPPNGSAKVELPGLIEDIGSGKYDWSVDWHADQSWPQKQLAGPSSIQMPDEYVP